MIARGLNPIDERKRDRDIPTFGDLADEVRESLSASFRNEKHKAAQWKSTLVTYAAPLWTKPVDTITADDVLAVLKPIWTAKAETASRVRGRIEKVLDAAKARGIATVKIQPAGRVTSTICYQGQPSWPAAITRPWTMSRCRPSSPSCAADNQWRR